MFERQGPRGPTSDPHDGLNGRDFVVASAAALGAQANPKSRVLHVIEEGAAFVFNPLTWPRKCLVEYHT